MNWTPVKRGWQAEFKTAAGTAFFRTDLRLSDAAARRWDGLLRPYLPQGAVASIQPAGNLGLDDDIDTANAPDMISERDEVWIRPPEESRVQTMDTQGRYSVVVVNQTSRAEWSTGEVVRVAPRLNDAQLREVELKLRPLHGESALALLRPWWFVRGYDLEVVAEVEHCNRRAIRVRGTPGYDAESYHASGGEDGPTVSLGAERVEFTFDLQYDVLLHRSAFFLDREYESAGFESVEFDTALGDELFDPRSLVLERASSGRERETQT